MKDNKFVMGEEEDTNKTTASSHTHKKPTRHHVKRRSSGRVHVAKLAPMARANSAAHTDSEADLVDDTSSIERPVMRRSQSQRSLHRMSFDRKGFTTLTPRNNKKAAPAKEEEEEEGAEEKAEESVVKKTWSNPASLTDRVVAAPVEQTLNATADNLVVPKQPLYTKIVSPVKTEPVLKKQLLRSQFITTDASSPSSPSLPPPQPPAAPMIAEDNLRRNLSRTQQKVMLQRQQVYEENNNRHVQKVNKELNREYKCIRRYQDPMKDSLIRCLESLIKQESTKVNRNPLQHSMSSSVIPVIAAAAMVNQVDNHKKSYVPHLEQRQIAHRHHHLKSIALSRHPHQPLASSVDSNSNDKHVLGFSWNATTAFLDRMFNTK
ncbi:hypothetical protein INT47_000850 [Mucor saturninus]|uniref:Uncharacterized protein n=1 Tax=Mucor saturninus TaxID=64648 RepID=A0A8H7RNP1_9FUNG|nr:hypothetical protein INT47_000850 [Mucor saturninus]